MYIRLFYYIIIFYLIKIFGIIYYFNHSKNLDQKKCFLSVMIYIFMPLYMS